jgi:hypothetical protein
MFADQKITAAVEIALSRRQMAILDFREKSVYYIRGKGRSYGSLTHEAREGTKR